MFNGADEAAVKLFLKGEISYPEISQSIQYAMEQVEFIDNPTLDEIFETDAWARDMVYKYK